MNLGITDLKKGTLIDIGGEPFKVVEYSQKVLGRGGSIVSLKIKSLSSGKVLDKTYKGSEQIKKADVTNQPAQYLYQNGGRFYFMDNDSFDQFELSSDLVSDSANFIKDGDQVELQLYGGQPISLALPKNVNLVVTEAEEAVRGDTTSSLTKNVRLETGLTIKAPAFIKVGDVISVDTSSGAYRTRVKG